MSDQHDPYLSLSAASQMLGVHATTLRRWADSGAIPVYITPGGHRRFARTDITKLAERRTSQSGTISREWVERVLAETRGQLAQGGHPPAWLAHVAADERQAWRSIGRQLMGIVLRYVNSNGEDQHLLDEAAQIGATYAQAARSAGMPLRSALEAALFFRDSLIETALAGPEEAQISSHDSARLMRRISQVANVVQLAVAAAYE